jgi:hypothetical protein
VSTTPGNLPPPPPQSSNPTQVAGQQAAPSTSVPPGPNGPYYTAFAPGHTNTLAIVSLSAGIGSFLAHIIPGVGGFTVAVVAIVTGFMARGQIKKTGEQGMGLATAGIVIGIVHLALLGLLIAFILAIFVFGAVLLGMHR